MSNPIVVVNVSQQIAPEPNALQKRGALVSQGATNLAPQSYGLLTEIADLTPLLNGSNPLASLSWSGGVVTAVAPSPHGLPIGSTIPMTIAGATPTGYNGTYDAIITNATAFTYPLGVNPGSASVVGTFILEDVAELTQMANTFFGMGSGQAVYVLELGAGDASDGVTALNTFITTSPQFFYAYLLPRYWDADSDYLAFLASYLSTTKKTYFFTTTTADTFDNYEDKKCVYADVESPTKPATEFTLAADFYRALNYNPSSTNKVAPFAFGFVFGVTPYPTKGNSALLTSFKAGHLNYIGTGGEGGISDLVSFWGVTMDGRDFTYWYSVDWVQINLDLDTANAVINGSNNPVNPLYYDQDGINRLQAVAVNTMVSGVTFGLVLGQVVQTELSARDFADAMAAGQYPGQTVVNSVPFADYLKVNPSDYRLGQYAGLSVAYVPKRGFERIIYNVVVSDFATA